MWASRYRNRSIIWHGRTSRYQQDETTDHYAFCYLNIAIVQHEHVISIYFTRFNYCFKFLFSLQMVMDRPDQLVQSLAYHQ